ncbi:MAG: hypothetical protein ABFS09_08835 [Thermodesulfobacteriota bacterium]
MEPISCCEICTFGFRAAGEAADTSESKEEEVKDQVLKGMVIAPTSKFSL